MKALINLLVVLFFGLYMTSCELVGTIFKGGVWTGVILVVGILVVVIWGLAKAFGGSKD